MPTSAGHSPAVSKHRFLVLDAMRGVAALAVVQFHTRNLLGVNLFAHGYLAVDFFFLLSGFVISFAYQNRLDAGWPTIQFMKVRLVRLWPLYLFGLLLGAVSVILAVRAGRFPLSHRAFATDLAAGLVMMPIVRPKQMAFPLNFPSWSLFGEIVANLVHGLFLRRASHRTLSLWIAANGVILLAAALFHGNVDFGAKGLGPVLIIPRVLFSYILGMRLERWWQHREHTQTFSPFPPFLLLMAILAFPMRASRSPVYDILAILIFMPGLLLFCARAGSSRFFERPFRLAGLASYSIYILHAPFALLFQVVFKLPDHTFVTPRNAAWTLVFGILLVSFALLVDYAYDLPVRQFLRRRLSA